MFRVSVVDLPKEVCGGICAHDLVFACGLPSDDKEAPRTQHHRQGQEPVPRLSIEKKKKKKNKSKDEELKNLDHRFSSTAIGTCLSSALWSR